MSAHPAFPAIVGLWFAALLGLGSVVLPAAVFENLAEASGLSQYVVAAQPPLGFTARTLIAMAAAGFGAIGGLLIARQVIAAQAPFSGSAGEATSNVHEFAKRPRPLSVHDELAEEGIEAASAPLANGEIAEATPETAHDLAKFERSKPIREWHETSTDEPLDLGSFDEEENEWEQDSILADAPAHWFDDDVGDDFADHCAHSGDDPMTNSTPRAIENAWNEESETEVSAAPVDESTGGIAIVDLVDRFARALQQHREHAANKMQTSADSVVDLTGALPDAHGGQSDEFAAGEPLTAAPPTEVGSGKADADDDDVGLPSLSLPLSRERSAAGFAGVDSEPIAEGFDDESDGEAGAEEAYSSLLAMESPFVQPRTPVRLANDGDDGSDEAEGTASEPIAAFPDPAAGRREAPLRLAATAPAEPGGTDRPAGAFDTERRLREALERLQKMSGVG